MNKKESSINLDLTIEEIQSLADELRLEYWCLSEQDAQEFTLELHRFLKEYFFNM